MKSSLSLSMAPGFRSASFFVSTIILFLANANAVSSIPAGEFDSMLDTIRVRGYDLFCNAIVTSDVQFDLLLENSESSFRSFTFFAPTDASLFALDMTQTASSYTDTLRLHIVPRRLSLADLLGLPFGYSLPTLLPGRHLNLTRFPLSDGIAVDGVDIAFPSLYYGRDVVVHGLAGILSLRSPVRSSSNSASFPRTSLNSSGNSSVLAPSTSPVASPIPQITTSNVTSRNVRPPPPVQMKRTGHAPASEPTAVDSHSPEPAIFPVIRGNPPTSSPEILGSFSIQKNQTIHAPASEPTAVDSHSPEPAISPAIRGSSPASSPEIYLPAHTYVVKPVDSPGPAFTPSSESPGFHYGISLPPTGYSDEPPAPVSPDMWVPKKVEVSLTKTFTGGDQGQIETVDFTDEVPEMTRTLMEVQEMRTEKSEPLDSINGCVYKDEGLGLEHFIAHGRYQYMQCHRNDD
ncbi:hypothetical protein L6164_036257 [Bauhinia variegata]|uniref:Uncharacterized protein n=1 Tax=Bauhinia variegata TaxID=167791 RepID=A0ACB9KGG5_BAUVA|nr:hypothetical protein L6164_036257 [Bauhinia variegata]